MTYVGFYKFLFVIEVLCAETMFAFRLAKRKYFWLRLLLGALILLSFAAIPVPLNNFLTLSVEFCLLFALSVPIMLFCYDESFFSLLFCAIAAYTCQHFAYEMTNFAFSVAERGVSPLLGMYGSAKIDFSKIDKTTVFAATSYTLCYVAAYSLIYVAFAKRIRSGADMKIKSVALFSLVGAGLIVDIFLSAFVTYYLKDDFLGSAVNNVTNALCCVLLLACQFGQFSTKEARNEVDFLQRLYAQEKDQYRVLKENMEIINIKCHDMRHRIRDLTHGKNLSDEEVREIENSIAIYDSAVRTGNEVLDVILTEKGLRCNGKGIKLTCVADGGAISFLSEADTYSLFGNILDNAIDAVLKIDDEETRTIDLQIAKKGKFISVSAKNPYVGEVNLAENGLPITDKADKDYHGFGVKSIAFIVKKYDGELSVSLEDGVFSLNILFMR